METILTHVTALDQNSGTQCNVRTVRQSDLWPIVELYFWSD